MARGGRGARWVRRAALLLAGSAVAACASPPERTPVTASFVTPELFHVAVAGADAAEAPGLRQRFYAETEAFARANGCTSYRVMREGFVTAANINPRVSTEPSWVFGNRPVYIGLVECGLPDPRTAALPAGARR